MSVCVIDEKSSKARGYLAIGDIYIQPDAIGGVFPLPECGWGKAGEIAQAKAKELGYEVEYYDHFAPRYLEDWE